MKKALVIAVVGIILLLLANVYYYFNTYNAQINTQKEILMRQSLICRDQVDQFFKKTQINILLLLSQKELDSLFTERAHSIEAQKRLELLFNRYDKLLKELDVMDVDGNTFGLKQGANRSFISTYGHQIPPDHISPKIFINPQGENINYIEPLRVGYETYGFVQFNMDMNAFFQSTFHNFNIKDYHFQWIIKPSGVVFNTLEKKEFIPDIKSLPLVMNGKKSAALRHYIHINGRKEKVLTILRKLNFHGIDYYMAFSMPLHQISSYILRDTFIVAAITLFVILFFIVWFGLYLKQKGVEEKRLKQSQESLRKVLYYLPVGVVLIDQQNLIRQVNKQALAIFEFDDEDQLLGQEAIDDVLYENRTIKEKTKYSHSSSKYLLANNDSKDAVILVEKIPFFLQSQEYSVEVYFELTLLELDKKLDLPGNTAKSTFIANISHELRTPLNGIIGMTDLIMGANLPSQETEMLKVVKRSADTLLTLINDILDFSKIEAGKFEVESISFNLQDEIENTIQAFLPRARESRIHLSWHSGIPLPTDFIGDPIRLRQVLNNLLSNAIKFTPANGRVFLSVSGARSLNGNRAVSFSLKDSGIGVSKDKMNVIFNPFSQADESTTRKYGGTGLGTTISKQLVMLMGGEITVKSPSGISNDSEFPGADFTFTLPLRSNKRIKPLSLQHITDYSQVKVLVISDDPLQVQNISKNLASFHIDFTVLPPSNETIDILRTSKKYHLVLIDHRPDFNGLEFLNSLYNHRLHNNFLIVIQSSDFKPANTKVAKQLGVDAYLRKPVKLNVLKEFLEQHFANVTNKDITPDVQSKGGLKVLVAEDNRLNQRVAKNIFRKIGFEIELANNGTEAISMAKHNHFDIIFMDIFMPEMDGVSAVKELKRSGHNGPIIAMTASNDKKEKDQAMDAGMDDYIIKPTRLEDISRMLTKWCAR
jgi:signal transduction histidine kinase/DNA-binding response OmpR family regulator